MPSLLKAYLRLSEEKILTILTWSRQNYSPPKMSVSARASYMSVWLGYIVSTYLKKNESRFCYNGIL